MTYVMLLVSFPNGDIPPSVILRLDMLLGITVVSIPNGGIAAAFILGLDLPLVAVLFLRQNMLLVVSSHGCMPLAVTLRAYTLVVVISNGYLPLVAILLLPIEEASGVDL
jgi:hypothetical protein